MSYLTSATRNPLLSQMEVPAAPPVEEFQRTVILDIEELRRLAERVAGEVALREEFAAVSL